jgi:hypothetical protein
MNIRSKDRHSLYASIGTITDDGSYHALAVPTKGIRICKLPPWVGSLDPPRKNLGVVGRCPTARESFALPQFTSGKMSLHEIYHRPKFRFDIYHLFRLPTEC